MATTIIIPAAGPAMAPEALFWLLAGVIWVVVQLLQRALRKANRPQPPPSIGGKEEKRDLDDFLEEMFERAGGAEREQQTNTIKQYKPQTYHHPTHNHPGGSPTGGSPTGGSPTGGSPTGGSPTGGSPTGGSPTGGSPTSGRPVVHELKSKAPKVHLAPHKRISLQEKRNAVLLRSKAISNMNMKIAQPALSTRSPAYAYMPSMPGLNLNQERGRRPHKLTAGLKSAAGLKRAVLWREILALPPMFDNNAVR